MPVQAFRVNANSVRQEATREPPEAVLALARHVEAIFARGVHDLPGLVAGLNARGSRAPGGKAWAETTLAAELARLADAP